MTYSHRHLFFCADFDKETDELGYRRDKVVRILPFDHLRANSRNFLQNLAEIQIRSIVLRNSTLVIMTAVRKESAGIDFVFGALYLKVPADCILNYKQVVHVFFVQDQLDGGNRLEVEKVAVVSFSKKVGWDFTCKMQ
jgi:hypothetical protein